MLNTNEGMAQEPKISREDDFIDHIYKEIKTFDLGKQNQILRDLYDLVKKDRVNSLEELKVGADNIERAMAELG